MHDSAMGTISGYRTETVATVAGMCGAAMAQSVHDIKLGDSLPAVETFGNVANGIDHRRTLYHHGVA